MKEISKSFSRRIGMWLALAEVSLVDYDLGLDKVTDRELPKDNWYFFSRLNVPRPIRRQGLATELMLDLVDWADSCKCNIVNPINPYGDLDLTQLVKFYKKFGFEEISEGLMIRLYKEP